MGQALYRKYRPRSLGDVVGQDHITVTLKNSLKKGSISHAYLFTGPKGVGKTSIARILAHEINGLRYDDDSMHLDIIEIDAASNRRIDEIRDLRDRVHIAPAAAKYKVYIVDEVHMLTREAFNALLKTLEEPPAHVVFILATTEVHKLPETIVSRTQRYTFKPVPLEEVVEHLRHIASKEKIDISEGALGLIASHGEGSFRDSISMLDQAAGHAGKIDEAIIQAMLGMPPQAAIDLLARELGAKDSAAVVSSLEQLHDQGFSAGHIAKSLNAVLLAKLLSQQQADPDDIKLLRNLLQVPAAQEPDRFIEIALLEYTLNAPEGMRSAEEAPKARKVESAKIESKKPEIHIKSPAQKKSETNNAANPQTENPTKKHASELLIIENFNADVWPKVLIDLKKKYNTLYGVVRMAQPEYIDGALELGFTFAFHRKQVSEKKNQQILSEIILKLTGQHVSIVCVEAKKLQKASIHISDAPDPILATPAVKPKTADLASISNIFGGGEILEQ